MKIQSVRLENFTVFEDLTINLSEGINIFIGKNGTGKTHLLKAVYGSCEFSKKENHSSALENYFCGSLKNINLFQDSDNRNIEIYLMINDSFKEAIHTELAVPLIIKQTTDSHEKLRGYSYCVHLPKDVSFKATYIPVKDMLTHSKGLLAMSEKYNGFPFDKTLTDIINRASQWKLKKIPDMAKLIMPVLEKMIDGEVTVENEEFFIKKHDGKLVNFAVEAEGLKKIGLLWQLIMNENITENSILIWDEPEANLNPDFIPDIVECLLELSRHDVQIFLSTHNYLFAKYFDVRRKKTDFVKFHSLYKENDTIKCESKSRFNDLKNNDIMQAYNKLVEEVFDIQVGD